MQFKSDLISQLLKIITPAVIAELSTDSSGKKKISLSKIVHSYCENGSYEENLSQNMASDQEAKILPFNEKNLKESNQEKFTFQSGQRVCALLEKFTEVCKKMESNLLGPKRIPKKKISSTSSNSSDYLIDQKKQFEHAYALLKSQEVLSLYKAGERSTVPKAKISQQNPHDDDFLADRERGVLINKKQA